MGQKTEFVNDYFREAVSQRRTNFAIDHASNGQYKALHEKQRAMSPVGFAAGISSRSNLNNTNVEYIDSRGRLPSTADVKFLAQLEEVHDYYAVLNLAGYPVSYADFRIAAGMIALAWDGEGTIELLGGQVFELTTNGQPTSTD